MESKNNELDELLYKCFKNSNETSKRIRHNIHTSFQKQKRKNKIKLFSLIALFVLLIYSS